MIEQILTVGSRGDDVKKLQTKLKSLGYTTGTPDGIFGKMTASAVMEFQKKNGEVVDGIVGSRTISALYQQNDVAPWRLTEGAYDRASIVLGVQKEVIKAVSSVESRGDGFLSNKKPTILFERHWMRRRLISNNLPIAAELGETNLPNIVNRNTGGYKGGIREWDRFYTAYGLNHESAIESASWGRYQIMGFHWESLGYESAEHFKTEMSRSEDSQMECFIRFINHHQPIMDALKRKDWGAFAFHYNGPNYSKNNYDEKIKKAYESLTK